MTFTQAIAALTPRQRETFRLLQEHGGWARPGDLGGSCGSHHGSTLRALAKKGIVDSEPLACVRGRVFRARDSLAYRSAA